MEAYCVFKPMGRFCELSAHVRADCFAKVGVDGWLLGVHPVDVCCLTVCLTSSAGFRVVNVVGEVQSISTHLFGPSETVSPKMCQSCMDQAVIVFRQSIGTSQCLHYIVLVGGFEWDPSTRRQL